jgi:hypothetical protein
MTAFVGNTESGPSNVVGPLTIGPSSGGSTVSGSVTFPGTVPANVPMYIGVYSNTGIYAVKMTSVVSPVVYSIPGVANGTYQNFAIIDMNNNGIIDVGDITNASGGNNTNPPTVTVTAPGPTNGPIALANPVTLLDVTTNHQRYSVSINLPDNYNVNFGVTWGSKRPILITLFSGPNVAVPFDMVVDQNSNGGQSPAFLQGAVPAVNDTYHFQVTYSDGSTNPDMTASVTAVLNTFALNLAMNSPVPSTSVTPATVPMLNWSAPSPTPTILPYTYNVGLYSTGNTTNVNWNYYGGKNTNGIPNTMTNVLFNVDGSAQSNGSSISALPGATIYNWWVTVQDGAGNSAQYSTTYTTP